MTPRTEQQIGADTGSAIPRSDCTVHTVGGITPPELVPQEVGMPENAEEKPWLPRSPVKRADGRSERYLVPIRVLFGSPWQLYHIRYRIEFGYSFTVVTGRCVSGELLMIRAITRNNIEEHLQRFRQLSHPNIVKAVEAYSCPVGGFFLVSEFMPTSLRHLCRAPLYPNEAQLSSLLYQLLSGLNFILDNGLIYDEVSVDNVLINYDGSVKICDIERCRRAGDGAKLLDSFSRLMMRLMDKEKSECDTLALTCPDSWSAEALDMFTLAVSKSTVKGLLGYDFTQKWGLWVDQENDGSDSGPGEALNVLTMVAAKFAIKELLGHAFLQKRDQRELTVLVPFVLISALHNFHYTK